MGLTDLFSGLGNPYAASLQNYGGSIGQLQQQQALQNASAQGWVPMTTATSDCTSITISPAYYNSGYAVAGNTKSATNLAWLDRRVDEMRVRL